MTTAKKEQEETPHEMTPAETVAKLRAPFSANEIGMLPRPVKKDPNHTEPRYQCSNGNRNASMDGKYCGGYHAKSIHLDYVGHAAITNRLLQVDPGWYWEPLAFTPEGLPRFDGFGGLWIKLHVGGMERLGYGDAQGKSGTNAVKEIIGDALRNAGMRFGMGLDLWSKENLTDFTIEQGMSPDEPQHAPTENYPEPAAQNVPQNGQNGAQEAPAASGGMRATEAHRNWLMGQIGTMDEKMESEYLEAWREAGLHMLSQITEDEWTTAVNILVTRFGFKPPVDGGSYMGQ